MRRRVRVSWYSVGADTWMSWEHNFWTMRGAMKFAASKISNPCNVGRWRVFDTRSGKMYELSRRKIAFGEA